MAARQDDLHRARECLQAGQLRQAETLAHEVVQAEPGSGEGWLLVAAAQHGQGKGAEAAASYRQALRLRPGSADAHYGLAVALAELGDRDEAVVNLRLTLRLQPTHVEALINLGVALAEQGRLDEATTHLRAAVRVQPENARAHYNLGVALAEQGKLDEAGTSLHEALRLQPAYAAACYGLGNVLGSQEKWPEAIASYQEALRLKPDYGEAYNNLGLALLEAGRPAEAAVMLRQAVRLRPQAADGHNNLGLALAALGRFAEADRCYEEALRLNPGYVEAHNNLAGGLKDQGRHEEALACYQVALWLDPGSASTHWNRALVLLQTGNFAEGWAEYEWRWRRKQARPRSFPAPPWDGGDLRGRTILLYTEQGLGDMIQFIRYARLVKERGGRVLVECPGLLVRLFYTCRGIDLLVPEGSRLPAFDVQAPLMSLPRLLGTTPATIPAEVPYLSADPSQVEDWRWRLGPTERFRIGIAWQGNPHHQWDRHRSIPLQQVAALARVGGVELVSLQQGPGTDQLRSAGERLPVRVLAEEIDSGTEAFLNTAAIMKNLDLVVTADTAVAHLAGALGVPVWVALSTISDWRWLLGREDSPWYPTMRLFRQGKLGDWAAVFERMAAELRRTLRAEPGCR